MDIKNLISGILLLVLAISLLIYDNNKKDKTGMLKAIYFNLNFTRIGMIIIALFIITREIIKIF